jgi:dethiobiotin synthetase
MRSTTFFITGTDTGVGKTVLTALLVRFLRERGVHAAALKPICSGGRNDALSLHAAQNGALTLDEINPWHFRAPIAPVLAARRERKCISLADVLAHVHRIEKRFEVLLIESAGGLLSPLGENFNSRHLIAALRGTPIVVCPNRLGAVNQVLLTLEALPPSAKAKALIVLMSSPKPDASTKTNAALMAEQFDGNRIFLFPRLGRNFDLANGLRNPRVRNTLRELTSALKIFR